MAKGKIKFPFPKIITAIVNGLRFIKKVKLIVEVVDVIVDIADFIIGKFKDKGWLKDEESEAENN